MSLLRRAPSLLPLVLLLLVTLSPVAAQELSDIPCPPELACITYGDHVIELDPADGPLISVVVRREEVIVEDLDGRSSDVTVTVATFVRLSGHYILAAEFTAPATKNLTGAQLGDVYVMSRVDGDEDE